MEAHQEEVLEPMSPSAQFLRCSTLSLTILAVLEIEHPIDDSVAMSLLRDVFLNINPRFSSIMVEKKGVRKWKKVEVNLKEHVHVPIFPADMAVEYYDECFTEYLTNISMDQLPQNRPLWDVHLIKYPTKNAGGSIVFKIHHSLGDGYSLMGALLSCLQRLDDPSLPLTFPSRQRSDNRSARSKCFLARVPRLITGFVHTACDFGWALLKGSVLEDDISPIRSGADGIEFKPVVTTTTSFPIDQIKQIKAKLNVTINDVVMGIITFGTRLYMQKISPKSRVAKTSAIGLLNTRNLEGYKSVDEMTKPDSKMPWGNRFAFLHLTIPKLKESDLQNPLKYIKKAHRTIKRQRNSAAVYLTAQFLRFIHKIKGPETVGQIVHATLKNTSIAVSNLIGPMEKMAVANQPIKGLYFLVPGCPESVQATIVSYVGDLRIAMTMEKGFMDPIMFKSCVEYAFEVTLKAALKA